MHRLRIFVAALWWGSLSSLGFVVLPLLFAKLGTPAVAGAMAAKLFTAHAWLACVCACSLLLSLVSLKNTSNVPQAHILPGSLAIKFIVCGWLLALVGEWGVAARIVSARAEGGHLQLWHGVGSGLYVLQWLCAGATLWQLSRTQTPG